MHINKFHAWHLGNNTMAPTYWNMNQLIEMLLDFLKGKVAQVLNIQKVEYCLEDGVVHSVATYKKTFFSI